MKPASCNLIGQLVAAGMPEYVWMDLEPDVGFVGQDITVAAGVGVAEAAAAAVT